MMEAQNIFPSSSSYNFLPLLLICLICISTNLQISLADDHNTSTKHSSNSTYKNYLKEACNSTSYPVLCFKSLSPYTSTIKANDHELCSTALTVSLQAASNASSLVNSLSKRSGLNETEAGIIKDCVDEMGDSIDELNQSLKALACLNGSDVEFQISNIKTWTSAAITDEDTCTDGIDEWKRSDAVMKKIKKSVVNVARLTSNALASVNYKLRY